MMYRDSVDAFLQLVASGRASDITAKLGYLTNGIKYCSVRVELDSGAEYYIEAYEQEAEDLYKEATGRSTELRVGFCLPNP